MNKPVLVVPGAAQAVAAAFPGWDILLPDEVRPEAITGRSVDVWPVHDNKGYQRARDTIGKALEANASRVRLVRPHNGEFKPGWAVGDAIAAGWAAAGLQVVLEANAHEVTKESLGSPKPSTDPPPETLPANLDAENPFDLIPRTDLAIANRFVNRHGDNIRFTGERGWMVWSGKRWQADEKSVAIARLAIESAESMLDELRTAANRDEAFAVAKIAAQKRSVEAAIWLARSHHPERLQAFDANPMIFNCANGIIDLATGKLLKHDRALYCSIMTECKYDPDAKAPRWEQFLKEMCLGKQELIDYLQRVAGYLLTGSVEEQCLFFFHGGGSNGKSTFFETLMKAMGEYGLVANPEILMTKKHAGIPNDIARLRGVRACFMNETNLGNRFDEAKLKDLTGGDTLSARFLREEFFDFEPTHKLLLRGQHKPTVNGTDEGIWRRLRLIPCDLRLTPEQKDMKLMQSLRGELPGILAWMVRGCLAWQAHGLGMPDVVKDAVKEYREESDTLGRFIEECCDVRKAAQVKSGELHKAYREFCMNAGERYLAAKDFHGEMQTRGFEPKRTTSARLFMGIELKNQVLARFDLASDDDKF